MSAILIVDDHDPNRYLLRALLTASGYDVLEATNGVEALEQARRTRPDLIIADILMPQMDGFTLCRECKRDEELRDIPFVFYTATYTDPRDEALAMQSGAARFIVKPIENEAFIAILREVLQAHQAGQLAAPQPLLEEETAFYRLYNEALIRKLEDKMLQLEESNRALQLELAARGEAEEALREREKRFQYISELISDYAYAFHVEPDGTLRGEWLTESFVRMFGFTQEEIDARGGWQSMVHPDDLALAIQHAQKVVSGKRDMCEMRFVTRDGEARWLLDYAAPVWDEEQQRVVRIYGAAQDITERKRVEEQLMAQLDELCRWHAATLGREERILELKREVNELLRRLGEPLRYPSAEEDLRKERGNQ